MRQLKIEKNITSREEGLQRYFADINRYEMISPEEEVELARCIQNAETEEEKDEARNKLVTANLRFVVSVAKKFQHSGMSLTDLINEGNLGLIKAAEKFDDTLGFKFISYAVNWVQQSIMQALSEQTRIVHIPHNRLNKKNKIDRAKQQFEQRNERQPSVEELAAILNESEQEVRKSANLSGRSTSVDTPFNDDENCMLNLLQTSDENRTDANIDHESLCTDLSTAISKLNERERDVVKLSFGIGCQEMSLDEIGDRLSITRERVRQIKEMALRRLRVIGAAQLRMHLSV